MLIQNQYSKSILLELQIDKETQQGSSVLKKQTKPFLFFTRNCESIEILICFNIIPVYNGNLKSGIKNGTEVTLKLSSNIAGDSNDSNNYPQVSKFCKAYANGP